MNSVETKAMLVLLLLNASAIYGAEQEIKKTSKSDRRTYQPLEVSNFVVNSTEESKPIELAILQGQKDCAEKQIQEQRRLSALQAPMIEGRYVSQAAFLAAGIEPQLESLLQQQQQDIATLKEENERELRRAKRRACRGSCPAYTCAGLTVVLLAAGMALEISHNKCD